MSQAPAFIIHCSSVVPSTGVGDGKPCLYTVIVSEIKKERRYCSNPGLDADASCRMPVHLALPPSSRVCELDEVVVRRDYSYTKKKVSKIN